MSRRAVLAFAHDAVAAGLAWIFAYLLRFNFDLPDFYREALFATLVWVVPLQAAIFWAFGLYRGIWRYASLPDLQRILLAVAVATLAVAGGLLMLRAGALVPRSVLLLDPILLVMIMGGSRFAYRAWKEHRLYGGGEERKPVLVLGAGDAAVTLLKELERGRDWRVVGLLDDDPAKHGRQLLGVKVLGAFEQLAEIAPRLEVETAIIAMPSASHTVRRRAATLCHAAGLSAMTVPSFGDLVSGKVTVSSIRQVELDDLLGRDPVQLDSDGLQHLLAGKSVLVSGAGGSIGSELCRQIARFKPTLLVFLEWSEFALYTVDEEFAESHPALRTVSAIGDAKDPARVEEVFASYRPDVVFHAAAYKHVPLMENSNAWEAVRNNVLGTHVMAAAAIRHGTQKFILVSTDKAVNPTNVMGASKRISELVCQGLQHGAATQLVIVRFGNVLGSAGSVIPKFREQIAKGGPVTVTHPQITRYFMSIPEAAQLVLQAGLMGKGGEIYVLDMGEPIRIAELAREMIRLSGFEVDDIKIVYTGLRAGEKLYEEPLADGERTMPTPHPKLRIAVARDVPAEHVKRITELVRRAAPASDDEVKSMLREWLPEYRSDTAGDEAAR